jgi:hypothetical protein
MKTFFTMVLLTAMVPPSACSNRQWYQGSQTGQRNECFHLPESQLEECLAQTGMTYEEYERQRNHADQ